MQIPFFQDLLVNVQCTHAHCTMYMSVIWIFMSLCLYRLEHLFKYIY